MLNASQQDFQNFIDKFWLETAVLILSYYTCALFSIAHAWYRSSMCWARKKNWKKLCLRNTNLTLYGNSPVFLPLSNTKNDSLSDTNTFRKLTRLVGSLQQWQNTLSLHITPLFSMQSYSVMTQWIFTIKNNDDNNEMTTRWERDEIVRQWLQCWPTLPLYYY